MSLKEQISKLEVKINLIATNLNMNELWKNIDAYEEREQKNDSKNYNLSSARQGARMEVYIMIMERKLNE